MKELVADESVDGPVIDALRADGWGVFSISESMPSVDDEIVIAEAAARCLPLLTFDRDFGELVFRVGVVAPPSVVYVRTRSMRLPQIIDHVIAAFRAGPPEGVFLTIDRNGQRRRPLIGVFDA